MLIELLFLQPLYILPVAIFLLGFLCLVLSPTLYRIRKKKLIEVHPLKAIENEYTKFERIMFVAGVVLITSGFLGFVITSEFYYK